MSSSIRLRTENRMAKKTSKPPIVLEGRERVKAAVDAWNRLSKQRQKDLVDELIEARSEELRNAYTGVVAVSRGFKRRGKRQRISKTRTKRGAKKSTRQNIVCVVFRVKKKVKKKDVEKVKRRETFRPVPEHLFAFATVYKQRRLCAIPTDIDCQSDCPPLKIRANALPEKIKVRSRKAPRTVFGVLTCVVASNSAPGPLALSCYHVLAMPKYFGGVNPPNDCTVLRSVQNRVVAVLDKDFRGHLKTNGISFDSALAGIVSFQDLRSAVGNTNPARFLRDLNLLPDIYYIHTPHGVLEAEVARVHIGNLPVDYPGVGLCYNRVVVEADVLEGKRTEGGDSGSRVTNLSGNELIGMHIAGAGRKAYMFPAIDFLRLQNYGSQYPNKWLELVDL